MNKKLQYEAPALSIVEMCTAANMLAGSGWNANISDDTTDDDAVMSQKRKQGIWDHSWN